MGKYVYLNKKIDEEILIDWYINSTDEDTIWTKKHIDELLEDFVLIPKSSLKAIEEKTINDIKKQSVKHGRWFHINNDGIIYCSECNNEAYWDTDYGQQLFDFCPYCGAKMSKQ